MNHASLIIRTSVLMTAASLNIPLGLVGLQPSVHAAEAHAQTHDHDHDHDHDDHGHDHHGHDHHDDEDVVRIAPDVMREFGIEVQTASGGAIDRTVRLPGEVVFNEDRIAHVTPTVSGIVGKVNCSVGDRVKAGQVMALLNSRELAAARSEYLAAQARLELARANLERDQRLFESKVGPESAVLESRQAFQEAQIALNQAEYALHALGYSHEEIAAIASLDDRVFGVYELSAPIDGVVTQRHLTIGEVVEQGSDDAPFVVADLSTVWVNLAVYQRNLAHVHAGQTVQLEFGHGIPDARGVIAFVSPALNETTRTATARVVLENPDGHWRPGLFVTALIETGHERAAVVVPRSAVAELDGKTVVFVETAEGLEPREVRVGRTSAERAEILDGLAEGERYVARNVLAVLAEMNRAALEHAGHAH